ncbi:lantibiotic dehydratase [Longimicrobium sp.]|uniref:lantibiotic dehydratase n=1 Tax=Longimicrobium sp. TaxID=2029185 RepID=UPI003B3B49BB
MDDTAAGGDALFNRFVCRVSGAPADTVDEMRPERTLAVLRELQATERRLHAAREDVSQLLFAAIGAAQEKPLRNKLITLKRELYNLKPQSAERLDAGLAGMDPSSAAAVRAFAADVERARGLEGQLKQAYDAETPELRRRFRGLLQDADFRKGLMVSSRSLYGALDRYAAAADSGDIHGRDEKTERGLLRYYTRMVMKATPFATFCAIIPGTFVGETDGEPEGGTRFTGDPRAKRSFVRANKFLYGLFFDHLKTRPAFRHALQVERNPTLRAEGERLVFLTAIDGREVFQRLGDNEVLQLIASRFSDGGAPTLGDLIRALSSDPEIDATFEEAEAYLDKLIEIGFLRFHTGIREQDADWDLPFRALLDRIDDDHARQTSEVLATLRERIEAYTDAGVDERERIIAQVHEQIEQALERMEISGRLRKDMPFYEDATSGASAQIALTPGVRRSLSGFEQWVRATARLAWPRSEQATMRHFFDDYYGEKDDAAGGVPLLKFYEDFYREHFKAHVEKEGRLRGGGPRDPKDTYDVNNPFGLESIKELAAARQRLTEVFRRAWVDAPDAETVDIAPEAVDEALQGVETLSGIPRSMGAFGLMVPAEREGGDPSFVLHGASYTAGYGKYFSRFLYMLPDDVQEDVRRANAALTGELLAEICGDAQFNANLHPPLLRWEISYPTGESGATEDQLRSSEILVQRDAEDPQNLSLVHGPTGRRVIPVDLGFLNPRMRPPLYQLLSRFTPPVMYAPPIPESTEAPRTPAEKPKLDAEDVAVQPAEGAPADAVVAQDADTVRDGDTVKEPPPPDADTVVRAPDADTVEGQPGADIAAPAVEAQPKAEEKPPVISYRPRITFGGSVVLARRRWIVPAPLFPQRRPEESAADFFVRVNRWRVESGIPETVYLRMMPLSEARPPKAGEPAAEAAPAEAPAEIPGYEAPAGEADDPIADEHDEAVEAEAAPAAAEGEAKEGEAKEGEDAEGAPKLGLEDKKRKTQQSRDFYKPQFIDFANPLLVGLWGKVAQGLKNFSATIEERYPDRAQLPRHGDTSFATELVVQLYFPRGTANAAADAGELADALPGD